MGIIMENEQKISNELQLEKLFSDFKKEQETLYPLLNNNRLEVDQLEQILETIIKQKKTQSEKLAALDKKIKNTVSKHRAEANNFILDQPNGKVVGPKAANSWTDLIEKYRNIVEKIVDEEQKEEAEMKKLCDKEEETNLKITEKLRSQLALILDCNQKLANVKKQIIQLILSMAGIESSSLSEEDLCEIPSVTDVNILKKDDLKEQISDEKLRHVTGVRGLDILGANSSPNNNPNTSQALEKLLVFKSPLKNMKGSIDSKQSSSDVRAFTLLGIGLSEKLEQEASRYKNLELTLQSEKERADLLEKRLAEVSERLSQMQANNELLETAFSKFRTERSVKVLEEEKQSAIQTKELSTALLELKKKKEENTKLSKRCESLVEKCKKNAEAKKEAETNLEEKRVLIQEYRIKFKEMEENGHQKDSKFQSLESEYHVLLSRSYELEQICYFNSQQLFSSEEELRVIQEQQRVLKTTIKSEAHDLLLQKGSSSLLPGYNLAKDKNRVRDNVENVSGNTSLLQHY